ncbi:hypothetical protein KQI52_08790 [bacterium]|nr:hypothetical protein [bacterium]
MADPKQSTAAVDPLTYMQAARILAENGDAVPDELETTLAEQARPLFADPSVARDELWAILATPERDRGLRWLNKHGILDELIPSWAGNSVRREFRLNAVEQVHKEVWRDGLDEGVFKLICDTHDVVVDQRLNRWALTALATLLAGGDVEDPRTWTNFVRRDLHRLGATEAEIVWITGILLNFNRALLFLRGNKVELQLKPECAVAGLSTLSLSDPEMMTDAVQRVNQTLAEDVNPLDRVSEEDD